MNVTSSKHGGFIGRKESRGSVTQVASGRGWPAPGSFAPSAHQRPRAPATASCTAKKNSPSNPAATPPLSPGSTSEAKTPRGVSPSALVASSALQV